MHEVNLKEVVEVVEILIAKAAYVRKASAGRILRRLWGIFYVRSVEREFFMWEEGGISVNRKELLGCM